MHQRALKTAVAHQVQEKIEHLRVKDGRDFEMLARSRGAGQNKDARTDDGPDAERRQAPWPQRLLEPMFGLFRLRDQLVDGLGGE